MQIEVAIHGRVVCSDGEAGRLTELIVDPRRRHLTNIVVREHGLADSERLVPFELVDGSCDDSVSVSCTRLELHRLTSYFDARFVDLMYETPQPLEPSEAPPPVPVVFSKRVPEGEANLGRWALVDASDGPVGRLSAVVVDLNGGRITDVIVLTHHFLLRREVAVPARAIERFYSDYVVLRLSRRAIEALPDVPDHDASRIPGARSADEDLVPEDTADAGVDVRALDASDVEAAHLLADEATPRLRLRGFTDEQILRWARAYLEAEHSGGVAEFVRWILEQESAPNVRW